jgi:predicted ATPase
MKDQVKSIQKMKAAKAFPNYIEYIRYPFYRNLEINSKITFSFPLTFFVGKNGGGKSSTLHSLYGCPKGYSLGDYWFSTELDPIKESKVRNCFIYGFTENDINKEVLKQRGSRAKGKVKRADPDYWETSRPVKGYKMDNNNRYIPIDKNVEYIDFRSELSAFDRYMYFMPFQQTKSLKTKQDYIRKYSKKIKEAFNSKKIIKLYNNPKNEIVKTLTQNEVDVVSEILGKKYDSIEILDHNFLKEWGFSIRFISPNHAYSEAFAGSGETAVIVLIHKIFNCSDGTLILLDEPEVSLHPGAQKRLRNYLLDQIKIKKLQIVISTHSPFLLEDMPPDSIKVFSMNEQGNFHIENEREPHEVFFELEIEKLNTKKVIIVEDRLAKDITEFVLKKIGDDVFSTFEVIYLPGGASALKQKISSFCETPFKPFIILDGDQRLTKNHINTTLLSFDDLDTVEKIDKLILNQTGTKINFIVDGNIIGNEIQKIELRKKYLNFYLTNVSYFPKNIPEEIIWDDDFALNKIESMFGKNNEEVLKEIKQGDSKKWFLSLCLKIYQSSEFLDGLHREFTIKWVQKNDDSYKDVLKIINRIRSDN